MKLSRNNKCTKSPFEILIFMYVPDVNCTKTKMKMTHLILYINHKFSPIEIHNIKPQDMHIK